MKKTLTTPEARFFAQVVPPDNLLVIFLVRIAYIDVSEDYEKMFTSLAPLTCFSTDFYGFFLKFGGHLGNI